MSQSPGEESRGEHGFGAGGESGIESGRESGIEGAEGSGGSEEGSGAGMLAPNETLDMTRGGAQLIMNYDPAANAFTGTVENTANNTLTNVRIEIHLSNGTELGPTTPVDMPRVRCWRSACPRHPNPSPDGYPTPRSAAVRQASPAESRRAERAALMVPKAQSSAAKEPAMSSPITTFDQT